MRTLDAFIAERSPAWTELDGLVKAAKGRPTRLGAARVQRLATLYREASADLALARRRYPGDPAVLWLEDVVSRAHHAVYASSGRRRSFVSFLTRDYWRLVRERPALLAVSAALLFGPMLLAAIWAVTDPAEASRLVPGAWSAVAEPRPEGADLGLTASESAAFSTEIFVNNIQVAFFAFAGGLSAGVITAAALLFNGLTVGAITGLAIEAGNARVLIELIVPHGVLELSCIVVAGAAGLRLAWAIVDPGRRTRGESLAIEARPAVGMALGTALWLVVAGLVEGFITPSGVGVVPAIVIGGGLGALYWGLVWWRGAPEPDAAAEAEASTGAASAPSIAATAGPAAST